MEHVIPPSRRQAYDRWHFSPAVLYRGTAFLSGVTGMRADGNYASDPQQQFTDLFDNIATVLDAARLTFADVIEMTSYHTDMASLPVFQNVKDQYLSEPWPAWTAVGVTSLALPEATAEVRLVCRDPSTD